MAYNVHTLYAVNFDVAGGEDSDFLLDQVSDFSVDSGTEMLIQAADGGVDPTFTAVMSQQPRIRYSTTAISTLFAANRCTARGFNFSGDADEAGMECWLQKLAEGGTRAAGSNHIKMTVIEGMLLPRTISASQTDPASCDLEAICTWDGTNDPVVIATSQALSGSPTVEEIYVAGPVSLNGSTYDGTQDITIDFGLTEIVQAADGGVWPTFVAIQRTQPTITIRSLNVELMNTLGLTGTAQDASDSVIYLKHVSQNSTRVIDATETHISFTIDEGHLGWRTVSASQGENAMIELILTLSYDGTNDPIAIDTTAAIV
jgi:hypothetical protein